MRLLKQIQNGYSISKTEAMDLLSWRVEDLAFLANEMRKFYRKDKFYFCSIINSKCGRCSENCKYCAQSIHNHNAIDGYGLLDYNSLSKEVDEKIKLGINKISFVNSGKRLSETDCNNLVEYIKKIKQDSKINLCTSSGLLSRDQLLKLKQVGLSDVHNNLETSRNFFDKICTTHTYDDKIQTILDAQSVGLSVCSGGIIGLGESWEDRIDMALQLKKLNIKSIPLNLLTPIDNTAYQNAQILPYDEFVRAIAIFRIINFDSIIRFAGGRQLLEDKGARAFLAGANGCITGNYLTTTGNTFNDDVELIKSLGYEACYE